MAHYRAEMDALGVTKAIDLRRVPSGRWMKIAGCVIVRQRPGTANGIVFISLDDESGVANAVVMPDMFQQERATIVGSPWLLIEGPIQNVDNVIHLVAKKISTLPCGATASVSHDFH